MKKKAKLNSNEMFQRYLALGTLKAVGDEMGLTRERIRQIINIENGIALQQVLTERREAWLKRHVRPCRQCGLLFFNASNVVATCSLACREALTDEKRLQKYATVGKFCKRCGVQKSASDFYPNYTQTKKRNTLVLYTRCKKCQIDATESWRKRNRPHVNAIHNAWLKKRKASQVVPKKMP